MTTPEMTERLKPSIVDLQSVSIKPSTSTAQRNQLKNPLQVVFRDLRYSVPSRDPVTKKLVEKPILKGVTGIFNPGRLSVILGASGAGKSSLLNVLAGEVHEGTISGELLVNGQHATGRELRKLAGYVYQEDIVFPTMTVREAMMMSATLRIPTTVSDDVKRERVNDLISLLHLNKAADTQIGDERVRGVSGGEKKRVCVGTELVTNPGVLFLDEPTSGLDSFTAYSVMRFLKRIARTGRTVVATIHQPSSEIFHLIDDLMLMAEGKALYFGPAAQSVDYFATHGYICPQYCNPADFFFMSILHQIKSPSNSLVDIESRENGALTENSTSLSTSRQSNINKQIIVAVQSPTKGSLDVTSVVDDKQRLHQLLDLWPTTPEGQLLYSLVNEPRQDGFTRENAKFKSSFINQFAPMFKRNLKNSIRDPSVIAFKLLQVILFSLLFGMIYWKIPNRDQEAQIQDRSGVLFFYVITLIMSNAMAILMVFSIERAVFERENHSGLYGLPAYFFSKMAIEIPIYVSMPFILVTCTYFVFGLHPGASHFFITALTCALLAGLGMSIGLVAASYFRQLTIALSLVPLFILPMMLFAGLFVNLSGTPSWIQWVKWLSPMKYGFVALMKNEFDGLTIDCGTNVPASQCVPRPGSAILESLGLGDQGSLWMNIGVIAGYWFILMVFSYVGLWRLVRSRSGRGVKIASK